MRQDNSARLYHVQVTPKEAESATRRRESHFDLSFEELEQRYLSRYRKAEPIVINGRTLRVGDIVRIRIFESDRRVGNLASISWNMMSEVTSDLIVGPPGFELESSPLPDQEIRPTTSAREVFVVHGRNLAARDALFEFLRSIDLHPLEWSEAVKATGRSSPYIGDILNAAFSNAHAVLVLFTLDDEARLRESLWGDNEAPHETELTGQARSNVLFEAGMAMGWSEDRTVLVELGTLRPFSDIAGRHVIRLDNSTQRRQELAQRLEAAGCPVKLDGTDWHTAGEFMAAISSLREVSLVPNTGKEQSLHVSSTPQLSDEAMELLIEAAKDSDGRIISLRPFGGLSIETNGKSFVESGDVRSEAKWEQAIRELLDQAYVEDRSGDGQVFNVTYLGFEAADSLGMSR